MPLNCSKKHIPDSEPFMGYISLKPFGAALSNYSNSLEVYGKDAAKCLGMRWAECVSVRMVTTGRT